MADKAQAIEKVAFCVALLMTLFLFRQRRRQFQMLEKGFLTSPFSLYLYLDI